MQLCKGDDVRINAPKNHCTTDKLLLSSRDTPIYARSSTEIVSNKSGVLMVKETKMMASQWKIFRFTYEIADEDIKVVKPCGLCFCKLLTEPEELFQ